jgi:hypothetical protein
VRALASASGKLTERRTPDSALVAWPLATVPGLATGRRGVCDHPEF